MDKDRLKIQAFDLSQKLIRLQDQMDRENKKLAEVLAKIRQLK
jgi:hypothetical protein